MANKEEMIKVCAKSFLLNGKKNYTKHELLRKFSKEEILPSSRQLVEWRIYSRIISRIKNGDIEINDHLGIFTGSFVSGLRDSGVFHRPTLHQLALNGNTHKELVQDLMESKLNIKISKKYKNYKINLSNCGILRLGVKNNKYNWKEYFGGLFAGCKIEQIGDKEKLIISPKSGISFESIISYLKAQKIVYDIEKNLIYISPFYGALFNKYMPIHSANRVIGVRKPYMGTELALVYWNMVREIGQPVAPPRANILPFAKGYATHWNTGMLKKTNIRKMGLDMRVYGISDDMREIMNEWIKSHPILNRS